MEQLTGVEYLNANDLGLERIEGLGKLKELLIFWAGLNKIKRLDADAFRENTKLEEIHLKFNRIVLIDEAAFGSLDKLLILDLSSNKLKSFGFVFSPLTSLLALDLSSNLIETFPENIFKNLGELKSLKLQRNYLKFLNPDVFTPLQNLEFVDVSFNRSPLETIPGDLFKHNYNLQQIYFVSSKIRSIDKKFFLHSKPSLEIVSFRTNECIDDDLTSVSSGILNQKDERKLKKCFENLRKS